MSEEFRCENVHFENHICNFERPVQSASLPKSLISAELNIHSLM